jgi:hypothetical protein
MVRYLLEKSHSGLGNRILSLLTAIPMAALSGRKLVVWWCDDAYSKNGENVVHRYFRSPAFSPEDDLPETNSVHPAIWRGLLSGPDRYATHPHPPELRGHPHACRFLAASPARLQYDEEIIVFLSYYPVLYRLQPHFTGEFAPLRRVDQKTAFRTLYRKYLQLDPAIQQRIDEIRAGWPSRPIIGVHARYTDRKVNLAKLHKHIGQLRRSEPDAAIFLATDNQEILKQFQSTYPHVIAPDRAYDPNGAPLHKPKTLKGAADRGAEALIDMHLLAASNCLVVDEGSTFSYIASMLSEADPSRIRNIQSGVWLPDRLRHTIWSIRSDIQFLPKTLRYLHNRQ